MSSSSHPHAGRGLRGGLRAHWKSRQLGGVGDDRASFGRSVRDSGTYDEAIDKAFTL